MRRLLGLLLFLAIVGVVALNFNRLLDFGQAHMIRRNAERAMNAGQWPRAIDAYRTGLRQYPGNTDIALRLAWLYERNRQPGEAEKIYRNILDREPASVSARLGLVNVLKGNPLRVNEAVDELRKLVKAHPDDPLVLAQAGNLYKAAAENPAEKRPQTRRWLYDNARYYYQLSLKREPEQFQTHFNLGVVHQQLEDRERAAAAYCQAILLKPDSYEARFNLGLALSEMRYLDEAYRQMDRAMTILSESDDAEMARTVARKVQQVKNAVYNNPDLRGLAPKPAPPFISPKCLLQPDNDRT